MSEAAVESVSLLRGGAIERQEVIKFDARKVVETPTLQNIVAAGAFAGATPCISIVSGEAGCGKTVALRAFCEHHRYRTSAGDRLVIGFRASPSCNTPTEVLDAIVDAISPYQHAASRRHKKVELILGLLRPGDVIVCDESQQLPADSLDTMREFLDRGEIGLLLIGNPQLSTRIFGRNQAAVYAQLSSRVGLRLNIPCPADGDIDAVLDSWGVTGQQARSFAREVARMPGCLRALAHCLRHAASSDEGTLYQRMRAAAQLLGID